jgi:hypothetical protein
MKIRMEFKSNINSLTYDRHRGVEEYPTGKAKGFNRCQPDGPISPWIAIAGMKAGKHVTYPKWAKGDESIVDVATIFKILRYRRKNLYTSNM